MHAAIVIFINCIVTGNVVVGLWVSLICALKEMILLKDSENSHVAIVHSPIIGPLIFTTKHTPTCEQIRLGLNSLYHGSILVCLFTGFFFLIESVKLIEALMIFLISEMIQLIVTLPPLAGGHILSRLKPKASAVWGWFVWGGVMGTLTYYLQSNLVVTVVCMHLLVFYRFRQLQDRVLTRHSDNYRASSLVGVMFNIAFAMMLIFLGIFALYLKETYK